MKVTRINSIALIPVAVSAALAWYFYPQLPDPVPTHWNAAGEIDGWTPKPMGVWLWPLIDAGLWVLMLVLPVISPRGFRLDEARRAYDIVWLVLLSFMLAIQGLAYLGAMGRGPGMTVSVNLLLGVLFIVLGNYLGKFPKNFFVGIRTPWTLASEQVWYRTHRLAGWTFSAAGVVLVALAFLAPEKWEFVAGTVAIAALVPVAYSLLLYRRLHGFGDGTD